MAINKNQYLDKLKHRGSIGFLLGLLIALIVVVVSPAGTALNAVFLLILLIIFLMCLRLVPYNELKDFYRFSIWVIVFAFFLHSWYELLHSALYEDWTTYDYMVIVIITFISAAADAVISWALFVIATLLRKGRWVWSKPWHWRTAVLIIALALLGQTIGEIFALQTNRWSYGPLMPTLPVLGVGLTPLLQMPLLILFTFWLAQRASCPLPTRADEYRS